MTALDPPPDLPVLDDEELALLDATATPASAGFADRVLAARTATQARGRSRLRWWAAACVACAAVVLAVVKLGPLGPDQLAQPAPLERPAPLAGALIGATRTTTAIGARGVAVVEPGAVLAWTAVAAAVRVEQPRGAVFYRVDPGGSFVVRTPAGEVSVEGTCFSVDVTEAAAGRDAALLVIVYEGRVAVSGPRGARRVSAGERLFTRAEAAPDASTVSARSESLQAELAGLRARVVELEAEAAALASTGPAGPDRGPDTVELEHSELIAMAAECRIAWDVLSLDRRGDLITAMQAKVLGVAEPDRVRLEQRLRALQQRALDDLRRLYSEVTGDSAEQLSWEALQGEIDHKSPEREIQEALRRISAERAGLAAPPADRANLPASMPPVERMYRMFIALGDEIEREVAAVLGPQRARALRAVEGGWGSRHSISRGCPR
jgi:FecR protein